MFYGKHGNPSPFLTWFLGTPTSRRSISFYLEGGLARAGVRPRRSFMPSNSLRLFGGQIGIRTHISRIIDRVHLPPPSTFGAFATEDRSFVGMRTRTPNFPLCVSHNDLCPEIGLAPYSAVGQTTFQRIPTKACPYTNPSRMPVRACSPGF